MSVRQLANHLDVATQVIYDWQNGKNAVNTERAQQIAHLFELDIIEVRRNLGLWVPDEQPSSPAEQADPPPLALWDAAEEHLWRTPILSRSRRTQLIKVLRALNAVPEEEPEEEPEDREERKGA